MAFTPAPRFNPWLSKGPVAPLIAAELRGRTELPRGEAAEIARKLGCSRERVRQIMGVLGVRIAAPPLALIDCAECGTLVKANKRGLCADCRRRLSLVELTCIVCGKEFQRRRKDYNDFIRRVVARGKRYGPRCSRACLQSVALACCWCGRSVGLRPPSQRRGHAFCGKPRNCWSEAMKVVQPSNWSLLKPEHLPMRDHIAQIVDALGPDRLTGGKPRRGIGSHRPERRGRRTRHS